MLNIQIGSGFAQNLINGGNTVALIIPLNTHVRCRLFFKYEFNFFQIFIYFILFIYFYIILFELKKKSIFI